MNIYRLTYLSGHYRVKGYLAIPPQPCGSLPHGCPAHSSLGAMLQSSLAAHFHVPRYSLLVEEVAPGHSSAAGSLSDSAMKPDPQPVSHVVPHPGFPQRPWPLLVYCRGGIGRVGMVKLDWMKHFAAHGFIVFAPTYRGADGSEGRDEFGGADQEDVACAIRWLRTLSFVDSRRITALGFSRGSINATKAAVDDLGVRHLILWGGLTDLAQTYHERLDLRRMLRRVVGGSPDQVPHGYAQRSPLHLASHIDCPVLVVHGTDDVQVHISHAERMIARLQSLHKAVDHLILNGYGHHLPSDIHARTIAQMVEWIKEQTP